jgi:Family of unknown function (DUF5681)
MTDPGEAYRIGFAKPPRETRFRSGRSGNPKGRPKGAKNFATALEVELRATVPVTENGRRRRLSKRQVIAKQLVNRATEGDLKAMPLLLNEVRPREQAAADALEEIFGGPEQQPLLASIVQRIRAADAQSPLQSPNEAALADRDQPLQLELPLEPDRDPPEGRF